MANDFSQSNTAVALGALRMLRPHDLRKVRKVRLGRKYDGGYMMLDRFNGVEAAYSLGINDDVSWDLDIAARGIPVFQYDHTIPALPEEHPLFHWEPLRISGVAEDDPGSATLDDLIARNGHGDARNMILKCDIEGGEWLLLQRLPNRFLRQFGQIVIEIHGMDFLANLKDASNVLLAFSNLTASHHVVHVHANNYSDFHIIGGIPVPWTLELTLARRDLGEFTVSDLTFPTPQDMPCNPDRADLYLGRFAFD